MRRPIGARPILGLGPTGRVVVLTFLLTTGAEGLARDSTGEPPVPAPLPEDVIRPVPEASAPVVSARAEVEGEVSPGLRIRLRGDGSTGEALRYRWQQAWGPPADLDDPTSSSPTLIVPRAVGSMAFVLVVRNAEGVDLTTLHVPIRWGGQDSAPPDLIADAGDDQPAIVGRQVTLNGIRSTPKGEIGYRWLQVDGPPVALAIEDRYIYTFVPEAPGRYRFALVVASGNAISSPAFVAVDVRSGESTRPAPMAATPADPARSTISAIAAAALRDVSGGPERAGNVAEVFDGVAGRIDLYASAAEAFREIALRLDAALPEDPGAREGWNSRVFEPISAAVLAELGGRGIDLARPEAMAAPLSPQARSVLAEQFRRIADGFRSVASSDRLGAIPGGDSPQPHIDQASATTEQGRGMR
ncbi:hypothetical protein AB1L88_01605 [Tautonia sp. JC769]|uniref:hypothetical protein n=1 Tax=Tautonia sp. JC769 TaxID=3232135 RepID=UPI00345A2FD2